GIRAKPFEIVCELLVVVFPLRACGQETPKLRHRHFLGPQRKRPRNPLAMLKLCWQTVRLLCWRAHQELLILGNDREGLALLVHGPAPGTSSFSTQLLLTRANLLVLLPLP